MRFSWTIVDDRYRIGVWNSCTLLCAPGTIGGPAVQQTPLLRQPIRYESS
jgi:hypothetical protein